jgi:hypothetical protein
VSIAQIGRSVRRGSAEPQPVRIHPLDVDGGQRSAELAGNLDRHGNAPARHTHDHRLTELERGNGLRQRAPAGGTITEERLDPRDDPHALIL